MSNEKQDRREPMTPEKEQELAEALDRYTNPMSPEYDADFHAEVRAIRPDWFDDDPNVQAEA